MLNFSEAFLEMRKGEALRRATWDASEYVSCVLVLHIPTGYMAELWQPTQQDLLANDWTLA